MDEGAAPAPLVPPAPPTPPPMTVAVPDELGDDNGALEEKVWVCEPGVLWKVEKKEDLVMPVEDAEAVKEEPLI